MTAATPGTPGSAPDAVEQPAVSGAAAEPAWVTRPPHTGPRVVHVNATPAGGGVAELLTGLVPAQQRTGTNVGWAVIGGTTGFYAVTKYLHHLLHGHADPGRLEQPGFLGEYREVLAAQAPWFARQAGPGDVFVLHDPQTLGLAPALRATGARLVWHCHIGVERPLPGPAAVWRAFSGDLDALDALVTTRREFAPPEDPARELFVVPPAVDPEAPKNRKLRPGEVAEVLDGVGLTSAGGVSRVAAVEQEAPLPAEARVVVQVSRWDPLKDMPGVLRCVAALPRDVHLVLVGTDPAGVSDDPEGQAVLDEVRAGVARLEAPDRRRVHLVKTATAPAREAALVVNAVQRRADVVLQKSLEEGFGLTVTEAMIKGRPVVATRVGGMREQITDGVDGLLADPEDVAAAREALRTLLDDPSRARAMGERARDTALRRYTMARLVEDYRKITAGPARYAEAAQPRKAIS